VASWCQRAGCECEGELYQTRGGAFFLVTTTHIPETDDHDARDKVEFDPMTAKEAQDWMLEGMSRSPTIPSTSRRKPKQRRSRGPRSTSACPPC
jgi:hypothetical protein